MPVRGRPRLYDTHTEKMRAYRERKRAGLTYPPLPPGPYSVLYAHPPWPQHVTWQGRKRPRDWALQRTVLERLPVHAHAAPGAVLGLWVPAGLLPEGLAVMAAWGFRYESALIWHPHDPQRHSADPEPELLLLGAHTGRAPAQWRADARVYVLPPARGFEQHPADFRDHLARAGRTGPRLELFAQARHEGWDAWGPDVLA